MSELNITEQHYFPTQIFSRELDAPEELNEQLLAAIYKERGGDPSGVPRSNYAELGGWHSQNHLYKDDQYKGIVDVINECADYISDTNGYSKDRVLKIGTMWSIINPPGGSNRAHIHPNCNWSGVYYVQTPLDCGKIEFIDPRTENLISQPSYIKNKTRPKKCWGKVNITPKAGKLLIFPSWLYHAVHPNVSQEPSPKSDRVIISFNLRQANVR